MAEAVCKMSLFSSCGRWPELGSERGGSRPFFASTSSRSSPLSSGKSGYLGRRLVIERQNGILHRTKINAVPVEMALTVGKAMKWWAKEAHPNMKEISSAQDLADSLSNAGDKLVIVDFFSPGCGGCRSLHPKICQFAEKNPDVLFLQTNYEEHKSMCYSLSVHVLPFFRFYRGAQGRLCSFSCTNATIKKFKDALAKNSAKRCSLGPAKGLEESELMALAANRDLFFSFPEKEAPVENAPRVYNPAPSIPGRTAMACAGRWAA